MAHLHFELSDLDLQSQSISYSGNAAEPSYWTVYTGLTTLDMDSNNIYTN